MTKLGKISKTFDALLASESFKPVRSRDQGHQYCYNILQAPLKYVCGNSSSFHLEEKDEQTNGIDSIWLDDLDSESVILKPDRFCFSHFKPGTYSRACDYVVLTKPIGCNGSELYAFYIDLKTDIYTDESGSCGTFDHTMAANWQFAWQMAGGCAVLDSLLSLGRKLKKMDSYEFRSIYIDIANIKKHDTSSRTACSPGVLPDRSIMNLDRHYWMIKNNNDRISAKDLANLF